MTRTPGRLNERRCSNDVMIKIASRTRHLGTTHELNQNFIQRRRWTRACRSTQSSSSKTSNENTRSGSNAHLNSKNRQWSPSLSPSKPRYSLLEVTSTAVLETTPTRPGKGTSARWTPPPTSRSCRTRCTLSARTAQPANNPTTKNYLRGSARQVLAQSNAETENSLISGSQFTE